MSSVVWQRSICDMSTEEIVDGFSLRDGRIFVCCVEYITDR